ncbi:phosphatidylethanolamine N-methyltransferase [Kappamyces sp. JEL0680]|nr:phosphatidylethanolamine N-methyltransferase [Kappamyces sp. JEL0680]
METKAEQPQSEDGTRNRTGKRAKKPPKMPATFSRNQGTAVDSFTPTLTIHHFLDLLHIVSFVFQAYAPLWLSLVLVKLCYLWFASMLAAQKFNLILWAVSKVGLQAHGSFQDRTLVQQLVRRLSLILVSNDLLNYLLTSWYSFVPPTPSDSLTILFPRWIGIAMMLFNFAYKAEYLWDTPFAWLDLYFTGPFGPRSAQPAGNDQEKIQSDSSSVYSQDEDQDYLIEASLIDKIPHPNYSIGCIGYYGMALFTQSYIVLFVSLFQHFTHVLFLFLVERPALYKTFHDENGTGTERDKEYLDSLHLYFNQDLIIFSNLDLFRWAGQLTARSGDAITMFIIVYTLLSAAVIGPIQNERHAIFYLGQAVFWRVVHSPVLGYVLYQQKTTKFWTRYFLRRGDGVVEAFQHWKLLFNLSLTMTYVSFGVCAWRFYHKPVFTMNDAQLLKHTIGLLFVFLHSWMTFVVFQVTGPLAWFHAEFFIDTPTLPVSVSVQRQQGPFKYFEHPLLYTFSCWGVVLICGRWELFWLTLFGQVCQLGFLVCVKDQGDGWWSKWIYSWLGIRLGQGPGTLTPKVSRDSLNPGSHLVLDSETIGGGSASLKLSRNSSMRSNRSRDRNSSSSYTDVDPCPQQPMFSFSDEDDDSEFEDDDLDSLAGSSLATESDSRLHTTIKRVVKELEELVGTAKPHVETLVRNTRRSVVNLANAARMQESLPLKDLPTSLYSLHVLLQSKSLHGAAIEADEMPCIPFGAPISVSFSGCRETMKRKDWVGIYPIDANFDPTITTSTCGSRWTYLAGPISPSDPINPDALLFKRSPDRQVHFGNTVVTMTKSAIPGLRIVQGKVTFSNHMIPWQAGVYEIRYHHDGKYNVITRSPPFRIVLDSPALPNSAAEIIAQLLPLVTVCLDLTDADPPLQIDEGLLTRVQLPPRLVDAVSLASYRKQVAQRIVYVILTLYGVDFSWKAVDNLYSLGSLADRVFEALLVLQ